MNDIERADGHRGWGVYPAEWGMPVGPAMSPEREEWVRSHVATHVGISNAMMDGRVALGLLAVKRRKA